jgi:hypothetical protein
MGLLKEALIRLGTEAGDSPLSSALGGGHSLRRTKQIKNIDKAKRKREILHFAHFAVGRVLPGC